MRPILYDFALAYHPAKARLMLLEKGVDYETRAVNLFNGQSLTPQFLKENPAGTVPVLKHGTNTIAESLQIVRYVDNMHPGPLGGDGVDRKFIEDWGQRVDEWDGNLFMAVNASEGAKKVLGRLTDFRIRFAQARAAENPDLQPVYERKIQSLHSAAAPPEHAKVHSNDQLLLTLLDTAEARLAAAAAIASNGELAWLAGGAYSQADVLLTVILFRIHMAKLQSRYIEPRRFLSIYCERVKERPSWKKAFGPALGPSGAIKLILPALGKAWWRSKLNCY